MFITKHLNNTVYFTNEENFLKYYIQEIPKTGFVQEITELKSEPYKLNDKFRKIESSEIITIKKTLLTEFKSKNNIKEYVLQHRYNLLDFLEPRFYSSDKPFMKSCLEKAPDTLQYFEMFLEDDEKADAIKKLQTSYRSLVEELDFINSEKRKQPYIFTDFSALCELRTCYSILFEDEKAKSYTFLYFFCKIRSKIKFESDYTIMYKVDQMWLLVGHLNRVSYSLRFKRYIGK